MYNHLFHITFRNLEWKSLSDASPIIICPCDWLSGGPSDLKMPRMGTELIFVTNITNYNFGEIWRNFGIFWEIWGSFGRFCHNFRAFMCRKLSPRTTFVEKKRQIWGLNGNSIQQRCPCDPLFLLKALQFFSTLRLCSNPLFCLLLLGIDCSPSIRWGVNQIWPSQLEKTSTQPF